MNQKNFEGSSLNLFPNYPPTILSFNIDPNGIDTKGLYIGEEKKEDQVSPGDLPGATKQIEIKEEVFIDQIKPVDQIPDYWSESILKDPLLVKTAENYRCIDGWKKIEQAQSEGKLSLPCRIKIKDENPDEVELAISKVALRIIPEGGVSKYPEKIWLVRNLFKFLVGANKDLTPYRHGGPRETGTSTEGTDAIDLICDRTGKKRVTVQKYLNHAEYLNSAVIKKLTDSDADKKFFEDIQSKKRTLASDLEEKRVIEEEITRQVSEAVLKWYEGGSPEEVSTVIQVAPLNSQTVSSSGNSQRITAGVIEEVLSGQTTRPGSENGQRPTADGEVDGLASLENEGLVLQDPVEEFNNYTLEPQQVGPLYTFSQIKDEYRAFHQQGLIEIDSISNIEALNLSIQTKISELSELRLKADGIVHEDIN